MLLNSTEFGILKSQNRNTLMCGAVKDIRIQTLADKNKVWRNHSNVYQANENDEYKLVIDKDKYIFNKASTFKSLII